MRSQWRHDDRPVQRPTEQKRVFNHDALIGKPTRALEHKVLLALYSPRARLEHRFRVDIHPGLWRVGLFRLEPREVARGRVEELREEHGNEGEREDGGEGEEDGMGAGAGGGGPGGEGDGAQDHGGEGAGI